MRVSGQQPLMVSISLTSDLCVHLAVSELQLKFQLQGNSQTKRPQTPQSPTHDNYGAVSPPFSPGSPLTYVPQMPMEPALSRTEDSSHRSTTGESQNVAGWASQPRLVPTKILCEPSLATAIPLHQQPGTSASMKSAPHLHMTSLLHHAW